MAELASVANVLDDAYVSSVDLLHERDIYDMLYDRYDEWTIVDFLEQTGREKPSHETNYHHFERDYVYQNITILSHTGVSAIGEDVTITLGLLNHDDGNSYPKVTDTVLFSNKLTGLIISKDTTTPTAHKIVVRPTDLTTNIVAATIDAQLLPCFGNAHAEGSDQPEGLTQKPLKFSFNHQIFKGRFASTGTEATNRVEVNVRGGSRYWMYEGEHNAYMKHKTDISFSMLFNQAASAGLTDVDGKPIRMTKGLAAHIRDDGNVKTGGVASIDDFDTIIKTLDKRRGSKENLFLSGINLDIDIDNVLRDKFLSGAIQYNTFGYNNDEAKNKAIDLGFNSIRKGNWTFHLKQMSEFNHENVTGAADQTWPDTGFVIPTDKGTDIKSGKSIDSICTRYKTAPHLDRKYLHWTSGAMAQNKSDNVDVLRYEYLSEQGLQTFGLNRFMILEG